MQPDVSVVIVNYNVRYLLEQCLHSLRHGQHALSQEIFVVDNASTDGSIPFLRERFPEVNFIELSENIGFGKANNLALQQCTGKYILILNPDTIVGEDTLQVLIAFLKTHPKAGIVTPKLIRKDGALDYACRRSLPTPWVAFSRLTGLSMLFPKSRLFSQYNLTYLNDDEPAQIGAGTGAFLLMPQEIYQKVGGFDEQFFMYGEDLDLCARVQDAGYEIHYRPETTAVHYRGESTRRSNIDRNQAFYGAMLLYAEKHYKGWARGYGIALLKIGILLAHWFAGFSQFWSFTWPAVVDSILIALGLFLGQWLRWGGVFGAVDKRVLVANVILVLLALGSTGTFLARDRESVKPALKGAALAGFISGTFTLFLLQGIMFSRAVVLISSMLWLVLLPGWRWLLFVKWGNQLIHKKRLLRTALIIGTDDLAKMLGERLQTDPSEYEFAGFVRYRNV
ncbi:MAG: glycosyltransferase, partial [bacterium]|nr:glycosyltransferase [bacterium]